MATAKKTASKTSDVHYHAPLVHIGASKDTVGALHAAIRDILTVPSIDNATRVAALSALTTGCAVGNTSLQGCCITGGDTAPRVD